MPRGDGTGPMGMGSMTGRAAGYCAGLPSPGFMNPIGGRLGLGRGGGRGFRAYPRYGLGRFPGLSYPSYYGSPAFAGYGMPYGGGYGMPYGSPQPTGTMPGAVPFAPGVSPEQELDFLKNQTEILKGQIDQVNLRIKELEEKK